MGPADVWQAFVDGECACTLPTIVSSQGHYHWRWEAIRHEALQASRDVFRDVRKGEA